MADMDRLLAQAAIKLPGGTINYPIGGNPGAPQGYEKFYAFFNNGGLGSILSRALPFVYAFAGVGLLVMLIMGGFNYLVSGGDAKKMQLAQQQITNAVIGFLVVFLAYWLTQMAGYILGLPEILNSFK